MYFLLWVVESTFLMIYHWVPCGHSLVNFWLHFLYFVKLYKIFQIIITRHQNCVTSCAKYFWRWRGGGEPPSSVEPIHGVLDLPDGYGKIFHTATTLPNAVQMLFLKLCTWTNPTYTFSKCCENVVTTLVRHCKLHAVYLLAHLPHIYLVNSL